MSTSLRVSIIDLDVSLLTRVTHLAIALWQDMQLGLEQHCLLVGTMSEELDDAGNINVSQAGQVQCFL